jgi:hypothetical protein
MPHESSNVNARIEWLGEVRLVAVINKYLLLGTRLLEDSELAINYLKRTLDITPGEERA